MTTTQALAQLPTLSYDILGALYGALDARARAATTYTGRTRAMNARERVGNEVSARGAVIRKAADGTYMVGLVSHFTPIGA